MALRQPPLRLAAMNYNFDTPRSRADDSMKWRRYGDDVLPLWVADMDFPVAQPIVEALHERVANGVFGYPVVKDELRELICARLAREYDWTVRPDDLFFLSGLVSGMNFAFQAFAEAGDEIIVQPPVYNHFFVDARAHRRVVVECPLAESGGRYGIDFAAFEAAISPRAKMFMLCNPHNPVGRVWSRAELSRLAEICLRHRLIICADEIHCDLLYPGAKHIPIASLSPEVAKETVTLMSPSKAFNLAGLHLAFAVIQNESLKDAWRQATLGLNPWVNIMGQEAAIAAYAAGDDWLLQVRQYLAANRDYIAEQAAEKLGLGLSPVEATYLAWLDCRELKLRVRPGDFFLARARVALNDGTSFGAAGEGFVRLNFACPRAVLAEALERMANALKAR